MSWLWSNGKAYTAAQLLFLFVNLFIAWAAAFSEINGGLVGFVLAVLAFEAFMYRTGRWPA